MAMGNEMKESGIGEYSLGDITLWLLCLEEISEADFARMYACCSKERRAAADRIKADLKRKQSVGTGYLLFRLRKRFSIEVEPVVMPNGKPVFPEHAGVHFNLSHSGAYAALAFGNTPLGLDVECVKQANLKMAKRFFAKEEYECLAEADETEQADIFTKLWTGKEAVVKASGAGLCVPLSGFSVIGEIVEFKEKRYELYRQKIAENGQTLWISAARLII